MRCLHCGPAAAREQAEGTELRYRRLRCRIYRCEFNERTGTFFNRLQYLTDLVVL